MTILALTAAILCALKLASSYNISWSSAYEYFDSGTLNPHLVSLRRTGATNDPEYLLICFEQGDLSFAGTCETLELDIQNNAIVSAGKAVFKDENANNVNVMQIYNQIWTHNFLLAYTSGPGKNDGPGHVLMGSFDPAVGSISYGANTYVFNSGVNDQSRLIELQSGGYVVICSSVDHGVLDRMDTECRIAQYDTSTSMMNIGTNAFKMTEDHRTDSMAVERIANDGFLACFQEYAQRFGACYVGTVTTPTNLNSNITFSNEILFHNTNNNPVDDIRITHVSADLVTICYITHVAVGEGGAGQCKYGAISQVAGFWTITILPQVFHFANYAIHSLSLFHVESNALYPTHNNPDLIVACFVDAATNGICRFGEIDLAAYSISFEPGVTENFHPAGTMVGATTTSYLGYGRGNSGEANYLVICYTQFSGSTPLFNRGFCKLGTITVD